MDKNKECEHIGCGPATETVQIDPAYDPDKEGRTSLDLCSFCAALFKKEGWTASAKA